MRIKIISNIFEERYVALIGIEWISTKADMQFCYKQE